MTQCFQKQRNINLRSLNNPKHYRHSNDSYFKSHAKIQPHSLHLNRDKQKQLPNSIPLNYYFDRSEKVKVIKKMIDTYFEPHTNPELSVHSLTQRMSKSEIVKKKSVKFVDNTLEQQSFSATSRSNQNSKFNSLQNTLRATKIFSSFVDSTKLNLPIIDEIVQKEQKRPHSEDKRRYVPQSPSLLKRRPSMGMSPQKQHSNRSSISNSSDHFTEKDIDLTQSLIFTKANSIFSRVTTKSRRSKNSISKQCNFYQITYEKDEVRKIFTPSGEFLLTLEKKLMKFGANTLMKESFPNEIVFSVHKSLKNQLYHVVEQSQGDERICLIFPDNESYDPLFKNRSQQFRDIIVCLCRQLVQIKNKIHINNIALGNVCRLGEKEIKVIDWSCSTLRERIITLNKDQILNYNGPTFWEGLNEGNSKRWVCHPQYFAPELLECLKSGKLNDQSLWVDSGASDVWSIGCMIFQIFTLIPLNARKKHVIQGRKERRRGLFIMNDFSYTELLRKQKAFSTQAIRILKKQCPDKILNQVDNRILEVMQKMLILSPERRIKAEDVIAFLEK